ncbi:PPE family protein [Mycobacterium sp. 663a-19]|uniref:PPE family protein n=1 Tax=Mycobacterium sp. 663a-19 TaxID=2986148 RepID=UPI002D1E68B3|nr:PPE family protein [Mycobacterium sp. 663a-19]MEB3982465.1 PPE family protein [Mycobacterium sp. 663a-19]
MDFGALPPEINSTRMYMGPGTASLLAASAAWDTLAGELHIAAGGYQSVIASLTQEWAGPSSVSMAAAVAPYLMWMRATATQCEAAASQAAAAAATYETAHAMTVPPPAVAANRVRLAALVATNILGQNTPAIMANEAEYAEMWAQDTTAMYEYAAGSAASSTLTAFTPPPRTTNPSGLGVGASAGAHAQRASTQLMSVVPQALHGLTTPGSSTAGTIAASGASSAASAPITALSSLTGVSGNGALKGIGKSAGALEGAATGLTGLNEGELGLVEDSAGLGMDAVGLVGLDGGGVGLDLLGVGLDFTGADELTQSGGLGGLGGLGHLGGLGPLGGFGGAAPSASLGRAASLGTLSVPPSWGNALSVPAAAPLLDAKAMPVGSGGALPAAPSATVSKFPLGGMIGRQTEGAVQRIGFRASVIPHSPGAG